MARTSQPDTCGIRMPSQELAAFCKRRQISELALFGSVLRDDFGPESDIDVLVSFLEEAEHGLFDMIDMEEELSQLLGRKVDLVSRRGIEAKSQLHPPQGRSSSPRRPFMRSDAAYLADTGAGSAGCDGIHRRTDVARVEPEPLAPARRLEVARDCRSKATRRR